MSDNKTEELYTIDIISKSPSVRTYLMERVLRVFNEEINDEYLERLYKDDEKANRLTDSTVSVGGFNQEQTL